MISAQEAINGNFDYNATPLAPLGCKVVVHEKPSQQNSWDQPNIIDVTAHTSQRRSWKESWTQFFPTGPNTPIMTPADAAIAVANVKPAPMMGSLNLTNAI
jgi:hypothetical protein